MSSSNKRILSVLFSGLFLLLIIFLSSCSTYSSLEQEDEIVSQEMTETKGYSIEGLWKFENIMMPMKANIGDIDGDSNDEYIILQGFLKLENGELSQYSHISYEGIDDISIINNSEFPISGFYIMEMGGSYVINGDELIMIHSDGYEEPGVIIDFSDSQFQLLDSRTKEISNFILSDLDIESVLQFNKSEMEFLMTLFSN